MEPLVYGGMFASSTGGKLSFTRMQAIVDDLTMLKKLPATPAEIHKYVTQKLQQV